MDVADWARAVAALTATLALLGLLAFAARRFNMLQPLKPSSERRLEVLESLMLDPRRRLVVVRSGDDEHVLLLSPFGDKRIASKPHTPLAPVSESPAEQAP